jgi:hypothetical protein
MFRSSGPLVRLCKTGKTSSTRLTAIPYDQSSSGAPATTVLSGVTRRLTPFGNELLISVIFPKAATNRGVSGSDTCSAPSRLSWRSDSRTLQHRLQPTSARGAIASRQTPTASTWASSARSGVKSSSPSAHLSKGPPHRQTGAPRAWSETPSPTRPTDR